MADQPELDMPAAPLTGERRIPITDPKLRVLILAMLGLRAGRKVLEEEGKFAHNLAGMQVARTLIDREYFETESAVHKRLVPVMAAAGIDLAVWQAWAFVDGGEAVICRPIEDKPTDGA
jgi:hypothetical protein